MGKDLLKIINHYRVMPQLKYFQSEVFELNEAIIEVETKKYFDNTMLNTDHITEEIADVRVMLEQFIEYYNIDRTEIAKIMNEKIERQLKRIEESK